MKVLMIPLLNEVEGNESGIRRVIEAYRKYLPEHGIEFVVRGEERDLTVSHAGTAQDVDVAHTHGLYWTADYRASAWEWAANSHVIAACRHAKIITCPSEWVAEVFKRDMRRSPIVVPHGIDYQDWRTDVENQGYVLWNKNRVGDVCDPTAVGELAKRFPEMQFVTTFKPRAVPTNVTEIGLRPHKEMKALIQSSGIYLATTKETFGIGILEAMAAGKPVLGFSHGGILDIVEHGVNGYLAEPNDFEDLAKGLVYCVQNAPVLGANGRELVKNYSWRKVAEQVADIYRLATIKDQRPMFIDSSRYQMTALTKRNNI